MTEEGILINVAVITITIVVVFIERVIVTIIVIGGEG